LSHCHAELDSHADTCGINNTAYVLEYTGKVAEVAGFSKALQTMQDIPIVKAALAYDDSLTGETTILIINQALYFGDQLSHVLLNQNQMRMNGLIVGDCPKHLSRGRSTHSIYTENNELNIPLQLNGVISYFEVCKPTRNEIETCNHINLTSEHIEWEPYSPHFANQENMLANHNTNKIMAITSINVEHDEIYDKLLHFEQHTNRNLSANTMIKKRLFVEEKELSRKWAVGNKVAEDTIKATTQSFIRSSLHLIKRRFKTKNVTLRYNHIGCRFTSATFFSAKPSLLKKTCGQLFMTEFGFGKIVPMKLKSEAGFALQELLQAVGIHAQIHTDGMKEMTLGTLKQVCNEAGIKMTNTEKGSPWQNRTEVEIRELKRHVRRLMG
jgi:hypothetical protein